MFTKESRVRIVPLYKGKKRKPAPESEEGLVKGNQERELFEGEAPAPPANARLTYNGGPLIPNVTVYTIFWGNTWSTDPVMNTLMGQINQFFTDILASSLINQLSEYNVPGKYTIGSGSLIGTSVISEGTPQEGMTIDDKAIRSALQGWIAASAVPQATSNMLYFIYLGNKVIVSMEGESSCQNFCGYHDAINNNIYYAVMPYPSCDGCLAGLFAIDAITGTSSHELCEAITDPVPPTGWYDTPNNMEIGDLCAWTFKTVVGHNVQNEWSNRNNTCD